MEARAPGLVDGIGAVEHQLWKWTFRLRAPPNRCTKVTTPHAPPDSTAGANPLPQGAEHSRDEDLQHIAHQTSVVGEPVAQSERQREHPLSDGDGGQHRSTRCAAVSAIRRPAQELQNPRPLQENATTRSSPQLSQCTRKKPWASTPHSRNERSSRRRTAAPGGRGGAAWPGRFRAARRRHHKGCFLRDCEGSQRPFRRPRNRSWAYEIVPFFLNFLPETGCRIGVDHDTRSTSCGLQVATYLTARQQY